jgi:hypothetical protein
MDTSRPGLRQFQTDYRAALARNWYWHAEAMKFFEYDPRLWTLTELQRPGTAYLSFEVYLGGNVDSPSDKDLKRAFPQLAEWISDIRKSNPKANIIWSPKTFKYFDASEKLTPTGKSQDEILNEFRRAQHKCAEELQARILQDSAAYHECVERARIIYEDKRRSSPSP